MSPVVAVPSYIGVSKMSKAIFIEAVAAKWRLRLEDVGVAEAAAAGTGR